MYQYVHSHFALGHCQPLIQSLKALPTLGKVTLGTAGPWHSTLRHCQPWVQQLKALLTLGTVTLGTANPWYRYYRGCFFAFTLAKIKTKIAMFCIKDMFYGRPCLSPKHLLDCHLV